MVGYTTNQLPLSMEECRLRGWDTVDIVLVTGDSYIDHPSFGVALIARLLESHGYRVAILSQPRYDRVDDFLRFGRPRLFFGITAGNLDSIVANYTGNGKVRDLDAYSTDGNPWRSEERSKTGRRRPDRATIIYANLARAACRDVPIVLGGVEASLRRFVHYDYKQNKLRNSVLTDGKADLLIYGMGEKAVLAAAETISNGSNLTAIPGSCERLTDRQFQDGGWNDAESCVILPSWEEITANVDLFLEAELTIDRHARGCSPKVLAQRQQNGWVVQHPAPPLLTTAELDTLYALPFTRKPHPEAGEIPAYRMICHSITIVRGCSGNCSFCAITRHQGAAVCSRSRESIVAEAQIIAGMDDFKGTISDLGGPTANLYASTCSRGGCKKHDCLFPTLCKHLQIDENGMIALLKAVEEVDGVRHVFISSGLRMELLLKTPKLLRKIIGSHIPGAMKIAPEHSEDDILKLMHKESHLMLCDFVRECRDVARRLGREIEFTSYIISAHPGSTIASAEALARKMKALGLQIRNFQDFTPTPGTLSTAMFVTGLDPFRKKKIHIPAQSEKTQQRRIMEQSFHRHPRTQSAKNQTRKRK